MGATEVEEFLTHLAVEGHVAASTQHQAQSALLFLYREALLQKFYSSVLRPRLHSDFARRAGYRAASPRHSLTHHLPF